MRLVRSSSCAPIDDSCAASEPLPLEALLPEARVLGVTAQLYPHYRCSVLSLLDLRGATDLRGRLPRPAVGGDEQAVIRSVREILAAVRERGDDAVRELTERFDGVVLDEISVPTTEWKRALDTID